MERYHLHPVASQTLASWRLFRCSGCSTSAPLYANSTWSSPSLRAQEIEIQNPTSDEENGSLKASLRGLRKTLNLGEARKKGDTSRVPDASGPCNSTLFDSPCRKTLLASAIGGGDGKLGGVKELAVQRRVEFEGSTKVDFH